MAAGGRIGGPAVRDKAKVCKALDLDASKWVEGGEAAFLNRYLDEKGTEKGCCV